MVLHWRGRGGGEAAHNWRGMQRRGGAQPEGKRREVATCRWHGVGGLEMLEKVVGGKWLSQCQQR